MEEKEMMHSPLKEEDLEAVSGGKYEIEKEEILFCPFCIQRHPIAVVRGRQRIERQLTKLYFCATARQYFYKKQNAYFDMNNERLPIGDIRVD